MRVLLLSKYDVAGSSSRVRFYQYIPYLEAAGIYIDRAPLLNDRYIAGINAGQKVPGPLILGSYVKRLGKMIRTLGYDLIWIEKEVFPYFLPLAEGLFRFLGIPYVVDYDDATYLQYKWHRDIFVRTLLKNKIERVMRHARVVIVGNRHLKEFAVAAGVENIEILPSVVDLERYRCQRSDGLGKVTIGWIGSPHTAKYLCEIAGLLNDLQIKDKAHIVLIGMNSSQFKEIRGTRYAWTEADETYLLNKIDIGIMPLKDGPWERGKCGYKLIQYMACGKPVVASPVGINKEIVRDGDNGFLASDSAQWAQALAVLCEDPGMRLAMGSTGRKDVEEKYSLQATAPRLIRILNAAGASRRVRSV